MVRKLKPVNCAARSRTSSCFKGDPPSFICCKFVRVRSVKDWTIRFDISSVSPKTGFTCTFSSSMELGDANKWSKASGSKISPISRSRKKKRLPFSVMSCIEGFSSVATSLLKVQMRVKLPSHTTVTKCFSSWCCSSMTHRLLWT